MKTEKIYRVYRPYQFDCQSGTMEYGIFYDEMKAMTRLSRLARRMVGQGCTVDWEKNGYAFRAHRNGQTWRFRIVSYDIDQAVSDQLPGCWQAERSAVA